MLEQVEIAEKYQDRIYLMSRAPAKTICGAKTRKGTSCMRLALDNGRCKLHGGRATGPKTVEGRERIRQAQIRRWEAYRAAKAARDEGKNG